MTMQVLLTKGSELASVLPNAFLVAILILVVAKLIHFGVSRGSEERKIQGEPACYWVPLGYFLGAIWGALTSNDPRYLHEAAAGLGGFGILIGYGIGMIHGGLLLWLARKRTLSSPNQSHPAEPDSTNPYQPPENPF